MTRNLNESRERSLTVTTFGKSIMFESARLNVFFDDRYSNNVRIPGHPTLPDDVSQPEVKCIGQAGHHDDDHEFPWWSPGTAPIFGSCGTAGGIPAGKEN